MILPLASIFDPEDVAEGSLDPLGTYLISESLAAYVGSPGIRERQNNLRFLTLCCIGWEVMASIEPNLLPGDPSSGMEEVFEWLVVEALVGGAMAGAIDEPRIPGISKAKQCLEQSLHLNADRYLRNASVFGFYGVYRTLAEYINLVVAQSNDMPLLGPEGVRLLEVWRQEQGLHGFGRGRQGRGQKEYCNLVDVLRQTWLKGQVVPNKAVFDFIRQYMHPSKPGGPKETSELLRLVQEPGNSPSDQNRREILKALEQSELHRLFMGRPKDELSFHHALLEQASPELRTCILAIQAYENFIRSIHDIFDDLLFTLSSQAKLLPIREVVAGVPNLVQRCQPVPELLTAADKALLPYPELRNRFSQAFETFGQKLEGAEFLKTLLEHHEKVQKHKSPDGKAPWIERQNDTIAVRPLYRRVEGAPSDWGYVYFYRAKPLLSLVRGARGHHGPA